MIRAFLFLIVTTTRNKIVSQLKRVRNPRYALALLAGLGYFWLIFLSQSRGNRSAPMPPMFGETFSTLLPVALLILSLYTWIFGADRSALAFTQAEVAMLFPAPVSRRGLIIYKLVRAQAAVITTSVIWLLLFRRGASGAERAVSFWLLLSIISMHRLGITLVRAGQVERGLRAWKKPSRMAALIPAIIGAVVGVASVHIGVDSHSSFAETVQAVLRVLKEPPASYVLYPFTVPVAPLFASTHAEWLLAVIPAFVLLILHFLWVIKSDSSFEEAAAEASAQRAQQITAIRSRGISAVTPISERNRRRTIPLASTGSPMVAIVWKNYLWLSRAGMLRTGIGVPLLLVLIALFLAPRYEFASIMTMVISGTIAFATLLFGPMTLRNDLRSELARAATMKTFPMEGHEIIFSEVASSGSAMAGMQYLYLLAALIASVFLPKDGLPMALFTGVATGALPLLLGLNLANFSVHNGLALMFPAWVRLGESGVNGIEGMGQVMLTILMTLVVLALMCVGPALAGGAVFYVARSLPSVAIAGAGLVAGALLIFETWVAANVLGGVLDRLEPMHVG